MTAKIYVWMRKQLDFQLQFARVWVIFHAKHKMSKRNSSPRKDCDTLESKSCDRNMFFAIEWSVFSELGSINNRKFFVRHDSESSIQLPEKMNQNKLHTLVGPFKFRNLASKNGASINLCHSEIFGGNVPHLKFA